MKVDVPLTDPQKRFVMASEPFPAICGGLGSGKSRAGTFRVLYKLLKNKGANVGYYMPTYDLIKLRAMPGVEEDLIMLGLRYTINKSEYTIKVPGFGSIIFRSYDRPERIIAYEVAHSVCDELDTLPKEKAALVWRKVSERNRQRCKEVNTIGSVTTPDHGFAGFMYEKWEKKKQPGYVLIKAPTASNPYLPKGYIDQIRANYDPVLADMYLNGEFVSLNEKKVYHFFDRRKQNTDRVIQPDDQLHISIDFNIGGCCATVNVIEGVKSYSLYEFSSYDTQDFINNLEQFRGHDIIIYPDASGGANRTNASASDIELIENAGYAVDAPDSNPLIRDRINAVNNGMAKNLFMINTEQCPELTNSLEMQGYTDKNEPEKFKEHPSIDDWNDSFGYYVHRRFPISKPSEAVEAGY